MHLTRRELLEIGGALLAGAPVRAADVSQAAIDETERRAADLIRGYSAEGLHRTATVVDRASADRLVTLARATGAAPSLEPFELSRVDPVAHYIDVSGQRVEGLPMFDGAFTGGDGVSGAIGPIDGDRPMGFALFAPYGEAALRKLRETSRHRAIVVVTTGGRPGLCPINAGWFSAPFGPPVLQVGSEHASAIQRASDANRSVHVVAHATRQPATAFNVVATVNGTRPDLPPVCVMTPRSGWHANASERGGGLACWLEAMRAVAATDSPAEAGLYRTVMFVASSGHDLGHLGLHAYLNHNPGLARQAFVWIHLGANIGASTGDTRMTPSDDALASAAMTALADHGLAGT